MASRSQACRGQSRGEDSRCESGLQWKGGLLQQRVREQEHRLRLSLKVLLQWRLLDVKRKRLIPQGGEHLVLLGHLTPSGIRKKEGEY